MNILIYIDKESNTQFDGFNNNINDFDTFNESLKDILRELLDIPQNHTLYSFGSRKKPVVVNVEGNLTKCTVNIPRFLWRKERNEREYIYLYPSYLLKYCPFTLIDLEWYYTENISKGKDALEGIEDHNVLVETSQPIERWIYRIRRTLITGNFSANLAAKYMGILNRLPQLFLNINDSLIEWITLLKQLAEGFGMKLKPYHTLAYGNYLFTM